MCNPLPTAALPPVGQGKAIGLPITALRSHLVPSLGLIPPGTEEEFFPSRAGTEPHGDARASSELTQGKG